MSNSTEQPTDRRRGIARTPIDASSTGPAPARVWLLGTPRCQIADRTVVALDRKTAAAVLLAVLDQGRTREQVAGLLWPESGESAARCNLRVLLHRHKEALGSSLLASGSGFSLAPGVWIDVTASGGDEIDTAMTTLQQPLLGGHAYDDLEELHKVIQRTQARLIEEAAAVLLGHGEQALVQGRRDEQQRAADLAQRVLTRQRTNEVACRLLMRALVALGQRSAALAAYEALRTALVEEFGTAPDRQTRLLQLDILRDNAQPALRSDTDADAGDALRTPRAVGRGELIDRLQQIGEQGRHVWLEGDAGVGKTRLVEELLLRSAAVRVRCRASDDMRPYAVVKRLIGQLEHERPGEAQSSMSELLRPDSQAGIDLQDVFDGVVAALENLRRDGVLQLVIEDVHHVDKASARLLLELCDVLGDEGEQAELAARLPALVLVAREQHDNDACHTVHKAALASRRFECVRLDCLDEAATQELATTLAQRPGMHWLREPGCARRLHRLGGGNPYFMIEIVRSALETPEPAALQVRVKGVEQLLGQRLQRASAPAAELSALLAVAQQDFDPLMPKEVLHQDGRTLAQAWHELMQLGVLDESGFAHDLAMAAAQAQLVGPQAHLLHEAVADFLARHGGNEERIAIHYLASHRPQHAVPMVVAAVKSLSRDGQVEGALALADEAFRRLPQLGDTGEGFEVLWRRHAAMLGLMGVDDPATKASADMLLQRQRSNEQLLIAVCMLFRGAKNRALTQDMHRWADIAWESPRIWPWWHAAVAASMSVYVDNGACLDAVEQRVEELVSQIDYADRSALVHETGLYRALTVAVSRLGHTQRVLDICDKHLASLDETGTDFEIGVVRRTIGWLCAEAGMDAQAVRWFEWALPSLSRRGQSKQLRSATIGNTLISLCQLGDLARALRLHKEVEDLCATLKADNFPLLVGELYLFHALGDHAVARECWRRVQQAAAADGISSFQKALIRRDELLIRRAEAAACGRPFTIDDAESFQVPPGMEPEMRLARCRALGAASMLEQAQAVDREAAVHGRHSLALDARTEVAEALCRLGHERDACAVIDTILSELKRWQPSDVSGADHARRLWSSMHRCGHPQADAFRDKWARWRDEQTAQLPPERCAAFRCRHAWVEDDAVQIPERLDSANA